MDKLREIRKRCGLTMKELGEILNVAESTISLYETGKREPDNETLKRIADYFQVSVDYLIGRKYNEQYSSNGFVRVPVIGTIRAGIPNTAIEDILDYEDITEEMARHGKHFGLKIKGNSMSPNLLENDVVIFRECEDADSGDVCAVLVNGDEATVKKIKKTEQGLFLIPYNTAEYEPVFFSHEEIIKKPVRIIGKAVEIRRTL